ncbi:MAG TPA: tyrosine-type recombinase/integrase [Pelagibacterium sp.]|uniref:tyrosine-type recombinase/integrase n=1 Tax=Pelagibacterium sp. TaxID=1967288 RepID=UPI002B8C52BD|nr:tyrosine-type recombinase/integrase [Pelagibacterium sp.]HWJ88544.1 tyrosine-type recombinase/integrase [Pelagibacterium sp.]
MQGTRKHKIVGVHRVRRRLASGQVVEYHYAWRGGPRIEAAPDTHEYLVEYTRLTRDREDAKREGFFPELVYAYRQSQAYLKLKPSTLRGYDWAIGEIEAEFCDLPIRAIGQRGARSTFLEWRDGLAETPRKADLLLAVLARILSFAFDREMIDRNPLERVDKISAGTRRDKLWTDADVEAFKANASPALQLAIELARWTGQRQGDLLTLPWSAYDGTHITLRQGKTGKQVRIRVAAQLKAALDATKRVAVTILSTERGSRSWTGDGFRASWGKACTRAKIEGLTFHDLRGTFVSLAYRNGASIKEISEITGHSEKDAEGIIRKHYLAGDAAIIKLDAGNKKRQQL